MKNPKIAIVGAGSTVFMKNIVGDALHLDAFKNATISLFDIDKTRLDESYVVAKKIAAGNKSSPQILATMNRKEALKDADFVVIMLQVGGYEPATVIDFEVPSKFGLKQTIGDTLGIGGIMRAARTIPVFDEICRDILAVCPNTVVLNYVNPMSILTWYCNQKFPQIKFVGLCHSVQETAELLSKELKIPYQSLRYLSAGINHVSFFLKFAREENGTLVDLYPALKKGYADGRMPTEKGGSERCANVVRFEVMKRFHYFVTESSEHFAEYTPWFIKKNRPEEAVKYKIPLDEYPKRCVEQIRDWSKEYQEFKDSPSICVPHSNEYAARVMNSIWTNQPSVINGNIKNRGVIENLPYEACVEVPCLIDANGINPIKVGKIPVHLSALMQTCINVQSCVIEAFESQNKDFIYHAAMLDPHTAAELTMDEIYQLVDALIQAHAAQGYMPEFLLK